MRDFSLDMFDKLKYLHVLVITLPLLFIFHFVSLLIFEAVVLVYVIGALIYFIFCCFNNVNICYKTLVRYFILPISLSLAIGYFLPKDAMKYNLLLASCVSLYYCIKSIDYRVSVRSLVLKSWVINVKLLNFQLALTLVLVFLEREFDADFSFNYYYLFAMMVMYFLIATIITLSVLKKSKRKGGDFTVATASLNHEEQEVKDSIDLFFNVSSLFLKCSFNLDSLSEQVNVNKKQLSQIINKGYGMGFYQLLSKRRIEIVLLKLDNLSDNHTIESVMIESGFSSKSVFNKYFKEFVGTTPSKYILYSKEKSKS